MRGFCKDVARLLCERYLCAMSRVMLSRAYGVTAALPKDKLAHAAASGSVDIVKYVSGKIQSVDHYADYTPAGSVRKLLSLAAIYGKLDILLYLRRKCPLLYWKVYYNAAAHGRMRIIRWLRTLRDINTGYILSGAMHYGKLTVLQYLYNHTDILRSVGMVQYVVDSCVRDGYLDCVQWFCHNASGRINSDVVFISMIAGEKYGASKDVIKCYLGEPGIIDNLVKYIKKLLDSDVSYARGWMTMSDEYDWLRRLCL